MACSQLATSPDIKAPAVPSGTRPVAITVYAPEGLDRVQTVLHDLFPVVERYFRTAVEFRAEDLPRAGPEYHAIFGRTTARAEVVGRKVYIETARVSSPAALATLLAHEVFHILQYAAQRPLHHQNWPWLTDIGHFHRQTQGLYRIIADRAKVHVLNGSEMNSLAVCLMNVFMDVDVYKFILSEGIVTFDVYRETLRDYTRDASHVVAKDGLLDDAAKFARSQNSDRRKVVYTMGSVVLAEWCQAVGGQWARAGPLWNNADAQEVVETYLAADGVAYGKRFGAYARPDVLNAAWRDLSAAGDDTEAIWRVYRHLAREAARTAHANIR